MCYPEKQQPEVKMEKEADWNFPHKESAMAKFSRFGGIIPSLDGAAAVEGVI